MTAAPISRPRQIASTLLISLGWLMVGFGLLTAFSGFGLAFLIFSPLPFLAGASLVRSKARIVQCLLILACWFIGLGFALA